DLEMPRAQWRPVDPDPAAVVPGMVLFADGVRRIDARVWVHGTRPQPVPGIAASFAAGLVCCDGAARIGDLIVERGLFTAAAEAAGITAGRVSYPARLAAGPAFEQLSLALQQRLTNAEVQLALTYRAQNPAADDLLVIDVTRLGDLTARVLPPLASVPHKDPRAPQNLVPIGGLERELRHRLGDQHVLYRVLRAAAMPVR